jgi:hypothetical protein
LIEHDNNNALIGKQTPCEYAVDLAELHMQIARAFTLISSRLWLVASETSARHRVTHNQSVSCRAAAPNFTQCAQQKLTSTA